MFAIPTVCAQKDIMGREMWEELDAPYLKRIVDAGKKKGAIFVSHNCGRGAYFDLLIKWLKPLAMHFAYLPYDCKTEQEMIEKYSNKIIFVGYVDTSLLALGTPSEVIGSEVMYFLLHANILQILPYTMQSQWLRLLKSMDHMND